jgi:type VI secretion system secreted protein Hcp
MGDIVMDIQDPKIEGDCTIKGHEKKIIIESLTWGGSAAVATTSQGSGQTFGGSDLHELQLTKEVNLSSPKLFNHCAQGLEIRKIEIQVLASGTQINKPILTYKLEGVLVTNLSAGGGSSGPLNESISLAVRKVEMVYHQLDENGNFIDNWPASFDLKTMQTT